MIPDKVLKELKKLNWPDNILKDVAAYLQMNNYTFYNLAMCDGRNYRVMYRDSNGKVSAELFPFSTESLIEEL